MVRRAKHAVGRGPERLETRCLLAADAPLIVEAVSLDPIDSTTLTGDITSPDEIDYFRFDIGQSGWLSVGGQPVGNSLFDGQIRLFVFSDANGNDSVEEDELVDTLSVATSFVGGPGTTYLLNPGTFVVSVSADLDETHQGEIGGYALSLAQPLAINLDNIETDRALVYRATSATEATVNSLLVSGVEWNFDVDGISNSPSTTFRSASLGNVVPQGLSLVVSSSGDVLIVNDTQPDTSASAGSGVTLNIQPINISATALTRIDTAPLPVAIRPATSASRPTTPSLLQSDSAGRSATRSIDLFRRGHSSQVGMIELALDEMLEAADDVLTLAADGLLKPLRETLGQPLEGIVPKSINTIEVSQPSWPLGRWLWQMVVEPNQDGANHDTVDGEQDNRSPVETSTETALPAVPESAGDNLEPEDEDRVSSIGQSSAAYLIGKQTKTTSGATGFASALVSGLLWGNTPKASGTRQRTSRDERYRRQLTAVIRRQMAQ